jgi:hypothetical protein
MLGAAVWRGRTQGVAGRSTSGCREQVGRQCVWDVGGKGCYAPVTGGIGWGWTG